MSGKHLVFLKEVMSPVFGTFLAGSSAKNIDAQLAADLIASGAAKETNAGSVDADMTAAADAAGRMSNLKRGVPIDRTEHRFSTVGPIRGPIGGAPIPDQAASAASAAPAPLAAPARKTAPAAPSRSSARAAPAAKAPTKAQRGSPAKAASDSTGRAPRASASVVPSGKRK